MASLNLIRSKNCIKTNVPTKANAKLKIICCMYVTFEKNNIEINIPNFAASNVPAVVGETNLFRLKLCIINPAMLIPAPANIIAIKRGTLLIKKTCVLSESQSSKSIGLISIAPINSEINDRIYCCDY